ncbi:zincin-like metallopeptidase domain-containing protein [Aquitalea pelogenes]|uniref:zincin-like metallopeptidase domain-containing protein n=1 Tax=Aquitalea pelogenes TaxID=1293573 RepID=UPI0035AF6589
MAYNKDYEKKDHEAELIQKINDRYVPLLKDYLSMIEDPNQKDNWNKPWLTMGSPAMNPVTGTIYGGINSYLLDSSKANNGDNRWLSFVNVKMIDDKRKGILSDKDKLEEYRNSDKYNAETYKEMVTKIDERITELENYGLHDINKPFHVKKDMKGEAVYKAIQVFASGGKGASEEADVELDGSDEGGVGVKSWWKHAYSGTVFNASQIENISPLPDRGMVHNPIEAAEQHVQAMVAKTGLKIEEGNSDRAFFRPSENKIVMPAKSAFKDITSYYDTLLHEIAHSTGEALGREKGKAFGDDLYSREELVAELTSVMMSRELGIPHNPMCDKNHAAYMKSWLSAIEGNDGKKNEKLLMQAMTQASRSTAYQMGINQEFQAEQSLDRSMKKEVTQTVEKPKAVEVVKPVEEQKKKIQKSNSAELSM